jgi:hypothetical protein
MNDLLEQFARAADGLAAVPDSKMQEMAKLAGELVELDTEIQGLEKTLKDKKTRRHLVQTKDLPDLMNEIGVDVTGVDGVRVELKQKCHASISSSWEDAKKQRAFEHLREIGGEDLIKQSLLVTAGRGSDEKMLTVAQRVRQMLAELELEAAVKMEPSVQWNTLTAFVRSVLEEGSTPVDLEVIGATYETVAEIVRKKER